jgi:hypothetical protein
VLIVLEQQHQQLIALLPVYHIIEIQISSLSGKVLAVLCHVKPIMTRSMPSSGNMLHQLADNDKNT